MNSIEELVIPSTNLPTLKGGPTHVTHEVVHPAETEEENATYNQLMSVIKELVDEDFDINDITFKPMTGGVTNTLFKCSFVNNQGQKKTIIIRLYGKGSENFIDRKAESYIQFLLSGNGVGPKFYGTFKNGCIYGFVEGDQLELVDLDNPNILQLIAQETRKWHSLDLNLKKQPSLLIYLNTWIENVKTLLKTEKVDINVDYYIKETEEFVKFITTKYKHPRHINFCHNDLIPRNMIYNSGNDVVKYIDFEYSGYNYRGFDIGNFFCEFSGLDLDYTRYPKMNVQKEFINYYLSANGDQPTEEEIHELYIEANHFTLGSHLMWGFWGIVQNFNSTIEFDYIGYALKRFQQYDLVKKKVYNL
ncbi:ethanolamine kinase B [Heterostelium album PN500]|uniref:ethanolamine kinase n=1 Tax=Heterostelium pallidum (strain ATCC 26659 / Pp 5 / PN500) TaxID=670386 RepID=D3BCF4_HETP5|nr:ethanolamine kinase B [Heterostelium album PN500]EFA80944.1 ethanolamine kinase B [Heterostelium album PN500]|eukprot:XP_020433062.1 ethanolamine kinase B [Heterostelium album PN500]